jgi:hypothetical protein
MRDVAVSRTLDASPPIVRRLLTPERVVDAEGSFDVREVIEEKAGEDDDERTVVTASRAGVGMRLAFTEREDGLESELIAGPLQRLETTYSVTPADGGSELTITSTVAVGGPAVLDRVAAWKRRGELDRVLRELAAECS